MKSEIEIRLRDFDEIPARITNLREEISTIETALVNVRAVSFDGTCSSGTFDPHWLDGRLSKLEILRCQLEFLCAERDLISRNLEELPENERRCLEILVIHKQRGDPVPVKFYDVFRHIIGQPGGLHIRVPGIPP